MSDIWTRQTVFGHNFILYAQVLLYLYLCLCLIVNLPALFSLFEGTEILLTFFGG
jgi:hypothetical protein